MWVDKVIFEITVFYQATATLFFEHEYDHSKNSKMTRITLISEYL